VPLHSNGTYSVVASVFIATGICLQSHCLAINVYSDYYSDFRASCHNIIIILKVNVNSHVDIHLNMICVQFNLDGTYIFQRTSTTEAIINLTLIPPPHPWLLRPNGRFVLTGLQALLAPG
jgi:hypothetical protein